IYTDFQDLISSGINNIWITDENFTANLGRAKRILNKFAELRGNHRLKIAISSWAKIDKEFVSMAQKAGVSVISFGVESKNRSILNYYNKSIDFKLLDEILEEADRVGVFTIGNFIVGAPDDDEETIQESLNYAIHSRFDDVNVKLLDYMIGSELYERLPENIKKGHIHLFSCSENGLTKHSKAELMAFQDKFLTEFQNSRKLKLLMKINKNGPPYYTEKIG
ncbi:radical SAM protein, partial [Desulfamplus magnetovallimortis]